MNLGTRLRELRMQRGLKLTAVAKAAGISQSSLSFIETGVNNPTVETLASILNVLGITLSDFFAEETSEFPPHLRKLLNSARDLTPDQVEQLTRFLETITNKETSATHDSRWEPLAAHRDDNMMDDLPEEAWKSIEEFKRFHRQEVEKERKGGK